MKINSNMMVALNGKHPVGYCNQRREKQARHQNRMSNKSRNRNCPLNVNRSWTDAKFVRPPIIPFPRSDRLMSPTYSIQRVSPLERNYKREN